MPAGDVYLVKNDLINYGCNVTPTPGATDIYFPSHNVLFSGVITIGNISFEGIINNKSGATDLNVNEGSAGSTIYFNNSAPVTLYHNRCAKYTIVLTSASSHNIFFG